jgi:uncharacterized protein
MKLRTILLVSVCAALLGTAATVAAPVKVEGGLGWPIVDGWVIPNDQYKLYHARRYNDTPILVGYNLDEGPGFSFARTPEEYVKYVRERFGPHADNLLKLYPMGMYLSQAPHTGPVPSEEGLKGLDAYFAWRRTPEGEVAVRSEAPASGGAPQMGISAKKPVFGGACKICPWGAMAEVVQAAMKPYGYDVQICYNCNAAEAPRIVSEAKVPPPYKPDPVVPEILAPRNVPGLGPIDFGAVAVQFLRAAYRGTGVYAKEKPRTNLRLIANIQDPSYVLVAAKAETGITDLAQIRQKRWPVRILSAGIGSDSSGILARFGLSREVIEAAGGRIGSTPEDRENFDVAIGGGGGMTTAPEWQIWTEISQKFNLNFIELPDDLLAKLARETEQERGTIPVGLYPGVVRPIPTVVRTGTVVYGRADMPDDFAYLVAKAMDEQQHLLQWKHLNFSYNVHNVWKAYEVPLHSGAARYYKERGYIK